MSTIKEVAAEMMEYCEALRSQGDVEKTADIFLRIATVAALRDIAESLRQMASCVDDE